MISLCVLFKSERWKLDTYIDVRYGTNKLKRITIKRRNNVQHIWIAIGDEEKKKSTHKNKQHKDKDEIRWRVEKRKAHKPK